MADDLDIKKEEPIKEEPLKEEEFKIKSEEEFEEKISGIINKALDDRLEKPEPEPEPEDGVIFKEPPKDWNEAGEKIISAYEEKKAKEQTEIQERVANVNKEYDKELEGIRETNPDLAKKGTKEGDDFERELAGIGLKFKGVTSMTEAYDIYQAKHVSNEPPKGEPSKQEPHKTLVTRQEGIAAKVSKGGSAVGKTEGVKYSRIAGKSMDDLLEEEKEKHGIE